MYYTAKSVHFVGH